MERMTSMSAPHDLMACMAGTSGQESALRRVASEFSPRVEWHARGFVVMDVGGLKRLHGDALAIGEALRHAADRHRTTVRVAIAATRVAAILMASVRDGISVVPPGAEAARLAPVPLGHLELLFGGDRVPSPRGRGAAALQQTSGYRHYRLAPPPVDRPESRSHPAPGQPTPELPMVWEEAGAEVLQACRTVRRWGLVTLGDLVALPSRELFERLGQAGLRLQRLASGQDLRPLVPQPVRPRFEESIALEWPIESTTALSTVLTRVLEPLSAALQRHDRSAAVLHVRLRLVTRTVHVRRLELPIPLHDPTVLRTLILLDLESHPPPDGIDEVQVVAEPAPGPVLQFSLLERARPVPERLSTVLARVQALMGSDRCGVPVLLDSHRPDAFAMQPFPVDGRGQDAGDKAVVARPAGPIGRAVVRRFRRPLTARVATLHGRPALIRMGRIAGGGKVVTCAGPWRNSGAWWDAAGEPIDPDARSRSARAQEAWDRDDWDVALGTGIVYRLYRDRIRDCWFVDGVVD